MIEDTSHTTNDVAQDETAKSLLVAQYSALRAEVLSRLDQRQQLLTYTMIGAASFFGLGLQSWTSAVTVLSYPPLALFLALAWYQHDQRIGEIAIYLRYLEDRFLTILSPGWESFRRSTFKGKERQRFFSLISLPARGLFVGSQTLSLLLGLARFWADPQMALVFICLALLDGIAIAVTALTLTHRRARSTQAHDKAIQTGVLHE